MITHRHFLIGIFLISFGIGIFSYLYYTFKLTDVQEQYKIFANGGLVIAAIAVSFLIIFLKKKN